MRCSCIHLSSPSFSRKRTAVCGVTLIHRALERVDEVIAQENSLPKLGAGIVLFRKRPSGLQVLLVHPGGPFWKNKDLGAWSIPKGEYMEGEDPLAAAKREFAEETGMQVDGDFLPLGSFKQPSGKMITAWALEGDCSVADIHSNTFKMEWPPKSGRQQEFPEIDHAEWFDLAEARNRILKGQAAILDRLKSQFG